MDFACYLIVIASLLKFHVVWCVLLAYALKSEKRLFYPAVLLNSFIILSTMLLGWHYLMDVVGGIALAGIVIGISEAVYKKYMIAEDEIISQTVVAPQKLTINTIENIKIHSMVLNHSAIKNDTHKKRHTTSQKIKMN